jgi:hypothetical protein
MLEQVLSFLIVAFLFGGIVFIIYDTIFDRRNKWLNETPEEFHKKYIRARYNSWIKRIRNK